MDSDALGSPLSPLRPPDNVPKVVVRILVPKGDTDGYADLSRTQGFPEHREGTTHLPTSREAAATDARRPPPERARPFLLQEKAARRDAGRRAKLGHSL